MTKQIISSRPASAAIAAALAFATTPLLAQTMDAPATPPAVQPPAPATAPPPVTVPQVTMPAPMPQAPAATAPTGPAPTIQMKAPSPVVQPVPERPPVAPVVAQEEPAAAQAAPSPTKAEKRAVEKRATPVVEKSAANDATPAPAPKVAPPVEQTAAIPAADVPPTVATDDTVAPVAAAPQSAVTVPDNSLEYGLMAGGAIALIGIGGALLLRRRRRTDTDEVAYEPAYEQQTAPVAPVALERDVVAAPSAFPQFSAQPAVQSGVADAVTEGGTLEAMAAQPPSSANPFLTRKNRLRRANFLLRQQQVDKTGDATVRTTPEAAAIEAATMPEIRTQTVHNFGRQSNVKFRFKPLTN